MRSRSSMLLSYLNLRLSSQRSRPAPPALPEPLRHLPHLTQRLLRKSSLLRRPDGGLLPAGGFVAAAELGPGKSDGFGVRGDRLRVPDGEAELQGSGAVADGEIGAGGEETGQAVGEETALGQSFQVFLQEIARRRVLSC